MKQMNCSRLVVSWYGFANRTWRTALRRLVLTAEGGEFHSLTLREIFRRYYDVDVGAYSYGACLMPGLCDPGTTVGRYSSLARTARVLNRNHPLDFRSTHAFFFNSACGYVKTDRVDYRPLAIGSDVWIGHSAIILPSVDEIGHGAVVGAGAVVTQNVPPYAVVVGNPGRVIRLRIPEVKVAELLASSWWQQDVDQLDLDEFRSLYGHRTS